MKNQLRISALFRRIFSIYATSVVFVLGTAFALPFVFAPLYHGDARAARARQFATASRIALRALGVWLVTEGNRPEAGKGSRLFVSNQCASLDFAIVAAVNPEPVCFLSNRSLADVPIIGWVVRRLCIVFDPADTVSRASAAEELCTALAAGRSVHVFPEGLRNRGPDLLNPLRLGAFHAAIQAQRPIHVLTIIGSNRLMSPEARLAMRPGRVVCVWGGPFSTTGVGAADAPRLAERAHDLMLEKLRSQDGSGF